jgi:hypothetical protein
MLTPDSAPGSHLRIRAISRQGGDDDEEDDDEADDGADRPEDIHGGSLRFVGKRVTTMEPEWVWRRLGRLAE